MNVLIYGAGGFLGSALIRRFVAGGHTVRGLVRNKDDGDALRKAGAEPVLGDLLTDPEGTVAHAADADVILYAAQLLLEPERHTVEALIDTLEGTGKTLIFTSGTGVLSQRTDGEWSEDTFAEDDEFVPSKYIGGRVDTENVVREANARGVRGIVVRPSMIWGHGRSPMLDGFRTSIEKTGAVCYIGRGLNLYSNVHVDDVAEIYHLAAEKAPAGALYHAVSGETNFRTIAQALAQKHGVAARSIGLAEGVEIWGTFAALIVFSTCSRTRAPRARRELGWLPHPDRLDVLAEIDTPVDAT
ncbi:NAD-dependent epimerase/dehydratase family protein [Rhodococcus artemisiae]|uniref:NAD-dependent epimerase/dehydratase family protein n=1 Tax=Rhodococcus artemisiae TaxID=714159 RepID=A0ABU7L7B3_9NOCA|nr:NAD-dependent epimerase/dehydratase family protein [Rhodococcus artemisiae]MEE2057209.1 NAD-dependent epimerase/dehydratase family protein [Rhodococcus artemisiae]